MTLVAVIGLALLASVTPSPLAEGAADGIRLHLYEGFDAATEGGNSQPLKRATRR